MLLSRSNGDSDRTNLHDYAIQQSRLLDLFSLVVWRSCSEYRAQSDCSGAELFFRERLTATLVEIPILRVLAEFVTRHHECQSCLLAALVYGYVHYLCRRESPRLCAVCQPFDQQLRRRDGKILSQLVTRDIVQLEWINGGISP